jgi:hypothetical protein
LFFISIIFQDGIGKYTKGNYGNGTSGNCYVGLLVKIMENEPHRDKSLKQMRRVMKENQSIFNPSTFTEGLQENISLAQIKLKKRLTIINP